VSIRIICPADHSVLNYDHKTCLLSLYLQLEDATKNCGRRLHTTAPEPFLFRQGSTVVFYTAVASRTFFLCKQGGRRQTTTRTLHGGGLIEGAASCHLSTDGVQLGPVLRVETLFTETAAPLSAPAIPLLHQEEELQAIRQFINSSYFDSLATGPATQPSLADITLRWGSAGPPVRCPREQAGQSRCWYLPEIPWPCSRHTICCIFYGPGRVYTARAGQLPQTQDGRSRGTHRRRSRPSQWSSRVPPGIQRRQHATATTAVKATPRSNLRDVSAYCVLAHLCIYTL
jgi:hypothetical protein